MADISTIRGTDTINLSGSQSNVTSAAYNLTFGGGTVLTGNSHYVRLDLALGDLASDGDYVEYSVQDPSGKRFGLRWVRNGSDIDIVMGYYVSGTWNEVAAGGIGTGVGGGTIGPYWWAIYGEGAGIDHLGLTFYSTDGGGNPDEASQSFVTPTVSTASGPLAGFDLTAVKLRIDSNGADTVVPIYGVSSAAFGGGGGPVVSGVVVTPATAEVQVGATEQLEAVVSGTGVTQDVTWSSTNTSVATVDSSGLVTGVGEGSCNIVATSDDDPDFSDSCEVTVPAPGTVYPKQYSAATVVRDKSAAPFTPNWPVSYTSSDPTIAQETAPGIITRYQAGAVTITAGARSGPANYSNSASLPE